MPPQIISRALGQCHGTSGPSTGLQNSTSGLDHLPSAEVASPGQDRVIHNHHSPCPLRLCASGYQTPSVPNIPLLAPTHSPIPDDGFHASRRDEFPAQRHALRLMYGEIGESDSTHVGRGLRLLLTAARPRLPSTHRHRISSHAFPNRIQCRFQYLISLSCRYIICNYSFFTLRICVFMTTYRYYSLYTSSPI